MIFLGVSGIAPPLSSPQSYLNIGMLTLARARDVSFLHYFFEFPALSLGKTACPATAKFADIAL